MAVLATAKVLVDVKKLGTATVLSCHGDAMEREGWGRKRSEAPHVIRAFIFFPTPVP